MLLPSVGGLASSLQPGTWPLNKLVDVSQFNAGAPPLPSVHVSQPTTVSVGTKAKHPLLKLQHFDGSRSLEIFLMKFQYMAAISLPGQRGHFSTISVRVWMALQAGFWELSLHASTADLTHLL